MPRSETALRRGGDESHANRVVHQTYYVVNLEPLHYLAAMAFDCLDAQLETGRDLSGAVTLGDHPQHLDLAGSELIEWAPQVERGSDRCREPSEVAFEYQVLGAGAETSHGLVAVKRAGHDDQRGRGANRPQQ